MRETVNVSEIEALIKEHETSLVRHEKEVDQLTAQFQYHKAHNYTEEARITQVKLDAKEMIVYRWRKMVDDLRNLLKDDENGN
jgi:hypothetical protein